jgi:excisionase family DNA binding protein
MAKRPRLIPRNPDLYSGVAELAADLGKSLPATYRALKRRELPAKKIGQTYLVSRSAVARFLGQTRSEA